MSCAWTDPPPTATDPRDLAMLATTNRPTSHVRCCPAIPAERRGESLIEQASRFIQAVVEIVAGDRPCTQVIRYADEGVYETLTRQLVARTRGDDGHVVRNRPRAKVVSVRVICTRTDVAEVSARVSDGTRSRALAARLEHMRGRWVCTALDIG